MKNDDDTKTMVLLESDESREQNGRELKIQIEILYIYEIQPHVY